MATVGVLPSFQHGVSGMLEILTTTKLQIRMFSYDGQAPGEHMESLYQKLKYDYLYLNVQLLIFLHCICSFIVHLFLIWTACPSPVPALFLGQLLCCSVFKAYSSH